MIERIFNFEKLEVWQMSRQLTVEIYKLTKTFPSEEKFSLSSQMQRASVSIVSNIAEGSSRSSLKDQLRFTEIAYGSLLELYAQLVIANELEYIDEISIKNFQLLFKELSNKLSALKNSQQKRLNDNLKL